MSSAPSALDDGILVAAIEQAVAAVDRDEAVRQLEEGQIAWGRLTGGA